MENDECKRNGLRPNFAWASVMLSLLAWGPLCSANTDSWRGLAVAPENRCTKYSSDDYPYSQSVEPRIVQSMGGRIYGPYTGTYFRSTGQTDIEHIVARSEAHDSGLCSASAATKKQFSNDLLNLTLASPAVNRHQKIAKDAAQWLPSRNRCWYANRIVEVKKKYRLSVDQREMRALQQVLSQCESTELVIFAPSETTQAGPNTASASGSANKGDSKVLAKYDDNGNGQISCAEARKHRIAPVTRDHPAYQYMRDGDGDGVVCE